MKLFGRLWRGEVKLLYTFWGLTIVGNIVFQLIPIFILDFDNMLGKSKYHASFYFGYFVLSGSFYIFSIVSIWRSATNYSRLEKDPLTRRWGTVAKVWIVLSVLQSLGSLLLQNLPVQNLSSTSSSIQSTEFAKVLRQT